MINKNYRFKIAFLISVCFINITAKKEDCWLNIFLHGIISLQPVLSVDTIKQIYNNNITNTLYEKFVLQSRNNSYFNKDQAKQQLGLHKIDLSRRDFIDGSPTIANIFDMQYSWIDPTIKNYYYTFGWSGFLTHTKRYEDAKILSADLSREIECFHKQGICPKIRLIGFSHGGSVCLNLSAVKQQEKWNPNFYIDELVLLGMPVQKQTISFTHDPLFKRIYHFYSRSDRVQKLDFSSYTKRMFIPGRDFKLPENLTQIKLRLITNRKVKNRWPKEKDPRYDFSHSSILYGNSRLLKKNDPGHCEWWFFNSTCKFYRENFTLAPLPVVAILPSMLTHLQNISLDTLHGNSKQNHVVMDVRPEQQALLIKNKQYQQVFPFLTEDQLTKIKQMPQEFGMIKTTPEAYNKHVQKCLGMAQKELGGIQKEPRDHRVDKT